RLSLSRPPCPTSTSSLSLHDALPIFGAVARNVDDTPHALDAVGGENLHGIADRAADRGHASPRDRRRGQAVGEASCGRRTIDHQDRKSTRLNSSHVKISYAVFCLKKK